MIVWIYNNAYDDDDDCDDDDESGNKKWNKPFKNGIRYEVFPSFSSAAPATWNAYLCGESASRLDNTYIATLYEYRTQRN